MAERRGERLRLCARRGDEGEGFITMWAEGLSALLLGRGEIDDAALRGLVLWFVLRACCVRCVVF